MTHKQKTWYLIAVTAVLLSIGIQIYLSLHHYELKLGLAAGPSSCNISETINCDTVATSKYSELFGIPLAALGLSLNAILLFLLLLPKLGLSRDPVQIHRGAWLLSLFSAGTSVVLALVSALLIKALCLYCAAAYVLAAVTLAALSLMLKGDLGWSQIKEDLASYFSEAKWILLTFISVPAIAWLGNKMYLDSYGFDQINLMVKESLANWKVAPGRSFSTDHGIVFQKQDSPKMTIVEFADFRCPHCKMASPTINAFASARKDVQVIFKSFPLDGTCNPHIERKGDGTSCFLAQTVLCAEKLAQKGWNTKKWVFENQERFFQFFDRNQILSEVATGQQLDVEALKVCVDSEDILQVIKTMSDEGSKAQIRGTPSFFINNKPLERAQALPVLNAVYSELD